MKTDENHLIDLAGHRLKLQQNYEPKLRMLVETRTIQLGFKEIERRNALRSIDVFVWKLTAAGVHLERLWVHREFVETERVIERVTSGEREPRRFTDKEVAFLTAELEAYLFQARAFITVAQVHTLDACRVPFGGLLDNEKYKHAVGNAPEDVKERLQQACNYFKENVFALGKWGHLLKDLRDKVAHFDRIRPRHEPSNEVEKLTVTGCSLEQLAQDFENGSYDLITEVIPAIWERKWQPGSPRPGMWDSASYILPIDR